MLRSLLLSLCLAVAGSQAALARDDIGGPFSLIDQDGQAVNEQTYLGKPALLYFGFTSCPDICPTDLARMAKLAKAVRESTAIELRPIFVTLDPQRDTPDRLKGYMAYYGKDFVGLTGPQENIAKLADLYHVYYKKVPFGDAGDYMLEHSTFLFLLDSQGRYLDHFGRGMDEAQIIQRITGKLDHGQRLGAL
ncbi:SCO family protein [Metapseudomonas resinovorans]|uniref:Uncharacterized protein n=1 Tax=Metapseudomonas resinovorans NBRC 106553 TaxID=1245471 RepID=S6AW55_METRE|nr:SCO family protein [Pseudomonas resinovorans]BAN48776.1 hypothetical protein PCA10_30440 [Pseudomonas resinovorans NBRC 106553]